MIWIKLDLLIALLGNFFNIDHKYYIILNQDHKTIKLDEYFLILNYQLC